jgi:hypothetical protein
MTEQKSIRLRCATPRQVGETGKGNLIADCAVVIFAGFAVSRVATGAVAAFFVFFAYPFIFTIFAAFMSSLVIALATTAVFVRVIVADWAAAMAVTSGQSQQFSVSSAVAICILLKWHLRQRPKRPLEDLVFYNQWLYALAC